MLEEGIARCFAFPVVGDMIQALDYLECLSDISSLSSVFQSREVQGSVALLVQFLR